tara:strand:+ start:105 stop:362 length:258 start_codon:yes stop_codon:yes gene_type:complete
MSTVKPYSAKELRKFIEFCSTVVTNKTTEQIDALPKDEHGFIDFSKLYRRHKVQLGMEEFSKAINDLQDAEAGEDLLSKLRNCEL